MNPDDIITLLLEQEHILAQIINKAKKYIHYQEILEIDIMDYSLYQQIADYIEIYISLWKSLKEWNIYIIKQQQKTIKEIDIDVISNKIQLYNKICNKAKRILKDNPVVTFFKQKITTIENCIPIIINIRNPVLEIRHWTIINEIFQQDIQNDTSYTLQSLININTIDIRNKIEIVSIIKLDKKLIYVRCLIVSIIPGIN